MSIFNCDLHRNEGQTTFKLRWADCQWAPISKKYRHSSVGALRVEIFRFEVWQYSNIFTLGGARKAQNINLESLEPWQSDKNVSWLLLALPDSWKLKHGHQSQLSENFFC